MKPPKRLFKNRWDDAPRAAEGLDGLDELRVITALVQANAMIAMEWKRTGAGSLDDLTRIEDEYNPGQQPYASMSLRELFRLASDSYDGGDLRLARKLNAFITDRLTGEQLKISNRATKAWTDSLERTKQADLDDVPRLVEAAAKAARA